MSSNPTFPTTHFEPPSPFIKKEFNEHGFEILVVSSPLADAEIALHGAHLTHFCPKNKKERIWLSPLANYDKNKAIRGGVPICWPWFGKNKVDPNLPQHGFARTSLFTVDEMSSSEENNIFIKLSLDHPKNQTQSWPYDCRLEVTFIIGETLTISVSTMNLDNKAMPLTKAIHTYFAVEDLEKLQLTGLEECQYVDKLDHTFHNPAFAPITIAQECDRVYQTNDETLYLIENDQKLKIQQQNGDSTIIWNPWCEKASLMNDFPDNGFLSMICVEAAITNESLLLQPGENITLTQIIG